MPVSTQNNVLPFLGPDLRTSQPEPVRKYEVKVVLLDAEAGIWGKRPMILARTGEGWIEFRDLDAIAGRAALQTPGDRE